METRVKSLSKQQAYDQNMVGNRQTRQNKQGYAKGLEISPPFSKDKVLFPKNR